MASKKIKKGYIIDYQIPDNANLEIVGSKIDKIFDILFSNTLEKEIKRTYWVFYIGGVCIDSIDINRQQGVYCGYGISNKERGCKIL
jgi:hypothetical protein